LGKKLVFFNVHYVLGKENEAQPPFVIFSNHKCYFVHKVGKQTLSLGIEENGIFTLSYAGEAKDYASTAKSGQNQCC
jgi:hypothetical protein